MRTKYPNFTTITAAETPNIVTDYVVLPQKIGMEQYPNKSGIAPGQNFTLNGDGLGRHHFIRAGDHVAGDDKFVIVNAGKADLPTLGYQAFFYNSCQTARDFGEVFQHGKFFCSNDNIYPDLKASVKFVEGLIGGKTWNEILEAIIATHKDRKEVAQPAYRLVEWK